MEFGFVRAACILVVIMIVNAFIMGQLYICVVLRKQKVTGIVREDSTLSVSLLRRMKNAEVTCLA